MSYVSIREFTPYDGKDAVLEPRLSRAISAMTKHGAASSEPPHLNWSTTMFRKRRTENGEQATEAGRDCLEVTAS